MLNIGKIIASFLAAAVHALLKNYVSKLFYHKFGQGTEKQQKIDIHLRNSKNTSGLTFANVEKECFVML